MQNKVMCVQDALDLIRDGDTLSTTAAGLVAYPEYIVSELEKRFLETGHPRGLTVIAGCGHGGQDHRGDSRFGHEGFLKRYLGSHPNVVPPVRKLIEAEKVEGYVLPQGIINQMYRCSAAKQAGILSKIGLGTYIDPRQEGGKINCLAKEDLVELVERDGEEWLFYKSYPIHVAIIRGTTADENGNLTIEQEALKLELLESALAAKASGGKVIAQVRRVVASGSLKPKDVVVPGKLVDAVVIAQNPEQTHMQTKMLEYDPYLSGELRAPASAGTEEKTVLEAKDIINRRAVFELYPGATVNVGIGIGAGIGAVAQAEGIREHVDFTLEMGAFGGTPTAQPDFGACVNADAYISQPSMFDFYHGGGLNVAVLGAAQIDARGNVNVSKFEGRAAGQGGFIDISQTSDKVVFCTYFTAKGLEAQVENGALCILQEGRIPKFVEQVEQITYSGEMALQENRKAVFITERAVFHLTEKGLMLTEIAPGVDLERDILSQMGFTPLIHENLALMDSRIFRPGKIGCFEGGDHV